MARFALWQPLALAFAAVTVALVLWIVLTRCACQSRRARAVSANAALVIFSSCYALLTADLLFGLLGVQSHGLGFTLAAKRWEQNYWHPINSYGYRDDEHMWADHVLFIVGDSFAAGYGVDRIEDRMSGVLARKLGSRWTVATLAKPGWDTVDEYAALLAHPKTPDVIVVSYFLNDIEGAAARHGFPLPQVVVPPPAVLRPLVDRSFLVNWLYWRFATPGAVDRYWSHMRAAYSTPEIFSAHVADLAKFVRHAANIGARLYFVMWPIPTDLSGSEWMVSKVTEGLTPYHANLIDLRDYLKQKRTTELVVNQTDGHPNAQVHAGVAQLILERLLADGAIERPRAVGPPS